MSAVPASRRGRGSLRDASRPAEPKVRAATDDNARAFAECRALGHTWAHLGFVAEDVRRPLTHFHSLGFRSVCGHCTTERIKWVSRYGTTTQLAYTYPAGYERRGEDRLSSVEWRRTWIVATLGPKA